MEKSSRIGLRVSPSEKEAWAIAAGGERKVSEWLRGLANKAAVPAATSDSYVLPQPLGFKSGACSRWMHHRKGVYCGSCSKVL